MLSLIVNGVLEIDLILVKGICFCVGSSFQVLFMVHPV